MSVRLPAIGFACFLIAACQHSTVHRIDVWSADDYFDPERKSGGTAGDPLPPRALERVSLAGAIEETVSFELAVTAGPDKHSALTPDSVSGVHVEMDLPRSEVGSLDESAVTLFRALPVDVGRLPGWHVRFLSGSCRRNRVPDVLIPVDAPRGGMPWTLRPDEPLFLLVDIHIPAGTAPGMYHAELRITQNHRVNRRVPVELTVRPFKLPAAHDVQLLAPLDHQALFFHHIVLEGKPFAPEALWSDSPPAAELDRLLTDTVALLREHRLTPVLDGIRPILKVGADGNVMVNWDDYDRVVGPFLDGTAFTDRDPLAVWKIPFDDSFPLPPAHGAMESPTHSKIVRQYLQEAARHFDERGWLSRCFVELPFTNQPQARSFEASAHFGSITHLADPRLRRMACLFPQDMSAYGWWGFRNQPIEEYIDVWCPPASLYDEPALARQRQQGRQTWMTLDRPPYSGCLDLSAPPVYARAIPWQAHRYHASAVYLDTVNAWPETSESSAASAFHRRRHAHPLLYPGSLAGLNTPLASVRLKRLRRGMQDLAYLSLLGSQGLGHIAETLAESLVPFAATDAFGDHFQDGRCGGLVHDERWWDLALDITDDELRRRLNPSSASESVDLGSTLDWQQFMGGTRRIRLEVDGVRIRSQGPRAQGAVAVGCTVTLTNQTRSPVEGVISVEDLPPGWEAAAPRQPVGPVPPGQSHRKVVEVRAKVVSTGTYGLRELPIVFQAANQEPVRAMARAAYLSAPPAMGNIVLDGDLADWPTVIGQRAGDFELLHGGEPDEDDPGGAKPQLSTEVLAVRDADNLYLAFTCFTSASPPVTLERHNRAFYDDLVPIGDDLVEVLIDPLNGGTHGSADLYHVVLSAGGAVSERGIGTDPPTGPREVWASDLSYSLRYYDDRWVAELRLPLRAFDDRARAEPIWGINFTRMDGLNQEYSTWSGARHNAYDPASLGNLAFPK